MVARFQGVFPLNKRVISKGITLNWYIPMSPMFNIESAISWNIFPEILGQKINKVSNLDVRWTVSKGLWNFCEHEKKRKFQSTQSYIYSLSAVCCGISRAEQISWWAERLHAQGHEFRRLEDQIGYWTWIYEKKKYLHSLTIWIWKSQLVFKLN